MIFFAYKYVLNECFKAYEFYNLIFHALYASSESTFFSLLAKKNAFSFKIFALVICRSMPKKYALLYFA